MINIGILQHRRDFVPLQLKLLNKISLQHKERVNLYILTDYASVPYYTGLLNNNTQHFKKVEAIGFSKHHNFMSKVNWLIQNPEEYSLRMDEDVFINHHVMEYMIDSVDILKNNNNLLLAPCFMTGVPTCDYFVEDFLKLEEKQVFYNILLNTTFSTTGSHLNPEAANNTELAKYYLNLNNHTLHSNEWNPDKFMESVRQIPHVYKGVHPVRVNFKAQAYMLNFAINNIDRFLSKPEAPKIIMCKYESKPYYCNHVHLIRNDRWGEAIRTYPHGFDEVSVNLFRQHNNLNYCFVRPSFGIHTLYSNVTEFATSENPHSYEGGNAVELEFYQKLAERIV